MHVFVGGDGEGIAIMEPNMSFFFCDDWHSGRGFVNHIPRCPSINMSHLGVA